MNTQPEITDTGSAMRLWLAAPAVIGSGLALLMLAGWIGSWCAVVVVSWLACSVCWTRRAGERLAVRTVCGFRRCRSFEQAVLAPVTEQACAAIDMPVAAVDWYIHSDQAATGYAVGRRSVALSQGLLDGYVSGSLTERHVLAVACHELAHLRTGSTRYGLVLGWLSAPVRLVAWPLRRLLVGLLRHVPLARSGHVLLPVVGVIASVQLLARGDWLAVAMLAGLAWAGAVHPWLAARDRHRQETIADAYTEQAGFGAELGQLLRAQFSLPAPTRRWSQDGQNAAGQRVRELAYRQLARSA